MPTTFAELGLGQLSDEEKLALVGHLWDDILSSAPPGGSLGDAQREEPLRRVDAAAHPDEPGIVPSWRARVDS
ncbi:MAG: addiction module protein [Gemmataceae bacterium]|nr:addiction module protein [Gemmataceae bacterium]